MTRILLIAFALAIPALASGPEAADVTVRIKPASPPPAETVRRAEIFRILQGGAIASDAAVSAHLWQVACSLAEKEWTPPRVIVRTVDR
jgi:hypothetical protein